MWHFVRMTEQPATNAYEFSVTELSNAIKGVVEDTFGRVRVRGELSRTMVAKSGHLYTTLKDEASVLDAVCWKGTLGRLPLKPAEGMEVICTGRITTYAGKSSYQLVIEHMELAGVGALLKLIEDRKKKLAAEGLFDEVRKKPLPFLPRKIGVITSPTGAVIRDILHRLSDRFPLPVVVWPVTVQGENAAKEVINALQGFNAMENAPDVLIIARGGGSVEDLMPFNDEALVRAVAQSRIPVISAVGHETDTTLCDYAADLRAPTPTAAAEAAVPVRRDLWVTVQAMFKQADVALTTRLHRLQDRLALLSRPLQTASRLLELPSQRLDRAGMALDHALKNATTRAETRLAKVQRLPSPQAKIMQGNTLVQAVAERLKNAQKTYAEQRANQLVHAARLLDTLSYKATLARGYAVVRDAASGKILMSKEQIKQGEKLKLVLNDGDVEAQVLK